MFSEAIVEGEGCWVPDGDPDGGWVWESTVREVASIVGGPGGVCGERNVIPAIVI